MMRWRPHTEVPDEDIVAIIAVLPPVGAFDDGEPYLHSELHQYHHAHRCWMSEGTGLVLHKATYYWLPELELLAQVKP